MMMVELVSRAALMLLLLSVVVVVMAVAVAGVVRKIVCWRLWGVNNRGIYHRLLKFHQLACHLTTILKLSINRRHRATCGNK